MYKVRGSFKHDMRVDDELGRICKWFSNESTVQMYLKNRVLEIYNSLAQDEKLSFMNNLKKDLCSERGSRTDEDIIQQAYFAHFGYARRMSIAN